MTYFVTEIFQKDANTLSIRWQDGATKNYDTTRLRAFCPCAICKTQSDEDSVVKVERFKAVRPVELSSVGRYAIKILFSDGHQTGIFPFALLYQDKTYLSHS